MSVLPKDLETAQNLTLQTVRLWVVAMETGRPGDLDTAMAALLLRAREMVKLERQWMGRVLGCRK